MGYVKKGRDCVTLAAIKQGVAQIVSCSASVLREAIQRPDSDSDKKGRFEKNDEWLIHVFHRSRFYPANHYRDNMV